MDRYFADNPALLGGCGVLSRKGDADAIQMRLPITEGRHR